MKTLTTIFSKVYFGVKRLLGIKKSESEMSVDEYIKSVQKRKQELSKIRCSVSKKVDKIVSRNDDFEAAGNLVLA